MGFVGHVALKIAVENTAYEKNKWFQIKTEGEIRYLWRFTNGNVYEMIAGVFEDKKDAVSAVKKLYVNIFYFFSYNNIPIEEAGCENYYRRSYDVSIDTSVENYESTESYFCWTKRKCGGFYGPGVYEVEDHIEEFEEYRFLFGSLGRPIVKFQLDIPIDKYLFIYCKKAQELFCDVLNADKLNPGLRMTVYCGLLEHLSDSNQKKEKIIIDMLDEFIQVVQENSILSTDQKNQLCNYFGRGKEISARSKCKQICKKYANENYGGISTEKILGEAYGLRSAFAHGNTVDNNGFQYVDYMKRIVLDVIVGYMQENSDCDEQKHPN